MTFKELMFDRDIAIANEIVGALSLDLKPGSEFTFTRKIIEAMSKGHTMWMEEHLPHIVGDDDEAVRIITKLISEDV